MLKWKAEKFISFSNQNVSLNEAVGAAPFYLFWSNIFNKSSHSCSNPRLLLLLRSESPGGKCAKLHNVAASNNRNQAPQSLYYCLFAPHIYGCCSSRTSRSWWIAHLTQRQRRDCNNFPSFLQRTAPIARSFCEVCTSHDLPGHSTILLRSESPSDKCAKLHTVAASNNRNHMPWSLYYCFACSHHIYMEAVLRAHPVRGESHIQRNASGEIATLPFLSLSFLPCKIRFLGLKIHKHCSYLSGFHQRCSAKNLRPTRHSFLSRWMLLWCTKRDGQLLKFFCQFRCIVLPLKQPSITFYTRPWKVTLTKASPKWP